MITKHRFQRERDYSTDFAVSVVIKRVREQKHFAVKGTRNEDLGVTVFRDQGDSEALRFARKDTDRDRQTDTDKTTDRN